MSSTLRRGLVITGIVVLALGLASWLRSSLGLSLDPRSIREVADGLGAAGPFLFVGIVAGRSLLALPSQVVLIAAGLCFGVWVGTLVGGAGLLTSGLFTFGAARYAGREAVERRLGDRFGRYLDVAGRRAGAVAIMAGTGYPFGPITPFHAAPGLTAMSLPLFVLAAFVGGVLRAATYAYFGNAITEADMRGLLAGTVGVALLAAAPLAFPKGRAWLRSVFGLDASS